MKEEIHVACPCCRNKRLFDADPDTEGIIKIKFTSINLPRGIDIRRAFDEACYVKTLILPDGLTVGKTSMFARCYELEKLILPYGIRVLSESMISYGNKLKSLVIRSWVLRGQSPLSR